MSIRDDTVLSEEHVTNYIFKCISRSSPEQYYIFDNDDNCIAYIRVRWGCLRVYNVVNDEICWNDSIFSTAISKDGWRGDIPEKSKIHLFNYIAELLSHKISYEYL